MSGMDAGEVEQAIKELRLQRALEDHVEAVEDAPEEVRRAAREAFSERFGTT